MRIRSRGGQSLVEFALVLPLLLIILFGIIDFGIAMYDRAVVTNAAREGARAGIVMAATRKTAAEIQDVVWNYCASNVVTFGNVAFNKTSDITVTGAGGVSGADLQVTVRYPYRFAVISYLLPSLATPTITASVVMKME